MNSRRYRRSLASLILGAWLFAMFVGISNACTMLSAHPAHAASMDMGAMDMGSTTGGDESLPANCLQFCADDTPVFSKLRLIQDQPAGHPVLVASAGTLSLPAPIGATLPDHLAHPPPDVPLLLRTLRFAL